MKTIHKYPLPAGLMQAEIEMPKGAMILSVQAQEDVVCIWALVDTEAPLETRRFWKFETGEDMFAFLEAEADLKSVGTIQLSGGAYVLHVFEDISVRNYYSKVHTRGPK